MIFITVGMQVPFNRLMRSMDLWCDATGYDGRIFAQTGKLSDHDYVPQNFEHVEELTPDEFRMHLDNATFVVSHAGMGTIISTLMLAKAIVLLPRRASLGEQRNDHQFGTVAQFADRDGVYVAMTEKELPAIIDFLVSAQVSTAGAAPSQYAEKSLIRALREELLGDERTATEIPPERSVKVPE